MTSPLSSFTVRGSAELQESVEPSLPATAFISSLAPYSSQSPQFLVDQSGVAGGLITLPGTSDGSGGFLSEAGKVMLQTCTSRYQSSEGADNFGSGKVALQTNTIGSSDGGGYLSETGKVVLQTEGADAGNDEGFVSGTAKVMLREGMVAESNNGAFLSRAMKIQLQPGAGEEGNDERLISGTGKALLQTGAEEQSSNGNFLSGTEKIIIQAGEEDTENGVAQGPLLYLDSATGLHVLVHHLPHSTPQQSGPQVILLISFEINFYVRNHADSATYLVFTTVIECYDLILIYYGKHLMAYDVVYCLVTA